MSILLLLEKNHDIKMSIRTLKRRLQNYGLKKKNPAVTEDQVQRIIESEINGPSSHCGYRSWWNKLRLSYNITYRRDDILQILKNVHPAAFKLQKAKKLIHRTYISSGSNACWHTDGYDKLKPFGFPIHGCMDGFSRKGL